MDVMLDFICMGPVDLSGARRKRQNTKWKIPCSQWDSNPQPLDSKSDAVTSEDKCSAITIVLSQYKLKSKLFKGVRTSFKLFFFITSVTVYNPCNNIADTGINSEWYTLCTIIMTHWQGFFSKFITYWINLLTQIWSSLFSNIVNMFLKNLWKK